MAATIRVQRKPYFIDVDTRGERAYVANSGSNNVSVLDLARRREIGVMKAIGARDSDIMRTFLVEAATLGLVGGVLGTAVGAAIALTIGGLANHYLQSQGLAGVQLDVPFVLPLGAVAGSTIVAVIAGLIPARRAAHLSAREAVES